MTRNLKTTYTILYTAAVSIVAGGVALSRVWSGWPGLVFGVWLGLVGVIMLFGIRANHVREQQGRGR